MDEPEEELLVLRLTVEQLLATGGWPNRRTRQKLEALAAGVMLADLQKELALAAVRAGLTPSAFADLKVEELIAAFDAKLFLRLLFRSPYSMTVAWDSVLVLRAALIDGVERCRRKRAHTSNGNSADFKIFPAA